MINNQIKLIFDKCKDPIFIAHNGNNFDHKIMRYYNIFNNDTKTIDSITILKLLIDKEKLISYKLIDIFNYYFNEDIIAHRAEGDIYMLIKVFKKIGIDILSLQGIV